MSSLDSTVLMVRRHAAQIGGRALICTIGLIASVTASANSGAPLSEFGSPTGPSATADNAGGAAAPPALAEVVVTAQKRSERAQDVGIAISAFSADQLQELGVKQLTDVARVTPGVSLSGAFAGQVVTFAVRGVVQQDFAAIAESPVAVYTDDGYVGVNNIAAVGLFDLDHVEVLKGPQGTLFGRNATGGLVNIVTKGPARTADGYIDYTYGSYNTQRVEAAVGGPLAEHISGRIAGFYNSNSGWLENTNPQGGDLGGTSDWGFRGKLKYALDSGPDLLLTTFAVRSRMSWGPYLFQNANPVFVGGNQVNSVLTDTPTPPLQQPNSDFRHLRVNAGRAQSAGDFYETQGVNLAANYQAGDGWTLTSITDFRHYRSRLQLDDAPEPVPFVTNDTHIDFSSVSQELRAFRPFGAARWTSGLYYLRLDPKIDPELFVFYPALTAAPFNLETMDTSHQLTNAYAAFSQLELDVAPKVTVVGGLRYTLDKKHFDYQALIGPQGAPLAFNRSFTGSRSDSLVTAKVQIEYRPVHDVLFYAGYNRGSKAGGFNAPLSTATNPPDSQIPYRPETLNAFEAGFKADGFEGRGRLNASVFYYGYHDFQAFEFHPVIQTQVLNRPARTFGADYEADFKPIDGLTLSMSGSYTDNRVQNVPINGLVLDRVVSYLSKWQQTILTRYEWPFAFGNLSLQADAQFRSSFFISLSNYDDTRVNPYWLFGARAAWSDRTDKWSIAVAGENLTDRRYRTIGFDAAFPFGFEQIAYGKPRWITLQVTRHF